MVVSSRHPIVYLSMTKSGYYPLEALLKAGKRIDLIVTLAKEKSQDVSDYVDFAPLAKKYGIPLRPVTSITTLLPEFQNQRPAVIIVNGWSQILKPEILAAPLHGCVGTHWALLPKNRGRAAIAWHFVNDEKYGGMTLFYLDDGTDSGPIIGQEKFRIRASDTASTYYQKVTDLGGKLLVKHYDRIVTGTAKARPQNHRQATYLLKRSAQDSFMDFSKPAKNLHNLVRAVYDIYALAFFHYQGSTYRVGASSLQPTLKYFGKPGQIAKVTDTELWVLAGDRMIILSDIRDSQGQKLSPKGIFKSGYIINE